MQPRIVTINMTLKTPNGPGVVQGRMIEGETELLLVRHTISEMQTREHGKCLSPLARFSALYAYPAKEILEMNQCG